MQFRRCQSSDLSLCDFFNQGSRTVFVFLGLGGTRRQAYTDTELWCHLCVHRCRGEMHHYNVRLREAWNNANAIHNAEHNHKSKTCQLGGTQFIDLFIDSCQREYWTAARFGPTASADMHTTTLNLGAHMYAREKQADACDRATKCALASVKA